MPSTPRSRVTRSRSPASSRSPSQRPFKRQRRSWSAVVEELALANGIEVDAHRVRQRQKQIDYGKNTIAYDRLSALLPREKRVRGHPMTPIAKQKCSKRSFAGQVTSWKKKVYDFVAKLDFAEKEAEKQTKKQMEAKDLDSVKVNGDTAVENEKKDKGGENGATREVSSDSANNMANADDDVFSAMEDIQLDDHGNVVSPVASGDDKAATAVEEEEEEEEEEYSDMEDIELDDMGNAITTSTTPPPSQGGDCADKVKLENSPPSIFDVY